YRLRVRFVGRESIAAVDDQEVSLWLNGAAITTFRWQASLGLDRTFDIGYDPFALVAAGNAVRLDQLPPGDPQRSRLNFVDYVELEYPRRLRGRSGVLDCD